MDYRILRGRNQIGGTITEITSSSARIYIDFGSQLSVSPEASTDPQMIRQITENPPDVIFFTHIHGDHMGLLCWIPDSVKHIYLGPTAHGILCNIRRSLLSRRDLPQAEWQRLKRELDILQDPERTFLYENGLPISVGNMTLTPLRTDHSVYDSYMLKIQADGKTILHTGDFRGHGRLGPGLLAQLPRLVGPLDVLITEGTMLSRSRETVLTEQELEAKAAELLKQHKYAFLICSSTNLESLASFYRANLAAGYARGCRPPFLVSPYAKGQLDLYTRDVGEKEGLRGFTFYRSYPIEHALEAPLPNGRTQREHMLAEGFLMLAGTAGHYRSLMEQFRDWNPLLIYSLWEGYLRPDKPYTNQALIDLVQTWPGPVAHLHTSGHAAPAHLARLITQLNPREAIVPIHTEYARGLLDLDIPETLKKKVQL